MAMRCPVRDWANALKHFRGFELVTGAHEASPVTWRLPQMNSCCCRVNSCKHPASTPAQSETPV